MYRFSATATISALAAGAEEILTIDDSKPGHSQLLPKADIVVCNPSAAAMTANPGLSISACWIASPGSIRVKITNDGAVALTAGSALLHFVVCR